MQLTVKKWGNSPAVRLPAAVMKEANLTLDQLVEVHAENGRIIIEPARKAYSLEELLAQCDPKAAMPDLSDWHDMKPQGKEVW
ncbi:AbrB/MazE/SpoVT family DNA-binding domain-containing protein [Crenobacter cavernae]|nr:AbrB/MazE/SpoVT family DNA-binding domain-containing protein [Crenobacter cavernae]